MVMRFVGLPAPSVRVADLAAIAQHERILAEIRHPEVIQTTRGIQELAGPTGDGGTVVSPRHGHDGRITC